MSERRNNTSGCARKWTVPACSLPLAALAWASAVYNLRAQEDSRARLVTLTTAAQVRMLSMDEANRSYPVTLEGIVTLVVPRIVFYVQDATGGVLVAGTDRGVEPQPGQVLSLRGHSNYGLLVPRVVAVSWKIIGEAPLPEPTRIDSDDLAAGRHVSEWVEVEGVVRSMGTGSEGRCVLRLDIGARVVDTHLIEGAPEDVRGLVDAKVRVRGVIAGFVNERRQMAALFVRASSRANVEVLEPAPVDPFMLPTSPVPWLMTFSAAGNSGHRMKVRGVVTGHQPGRAIFVREGGQSIFVHTRQRDDLAMGDLVEVVGFPEMGPISPRLREAVFRRVGFDSVPVPRKVTREELLRGQLDAELVTLDGELVDVVRGTADTTLVVRAEGALLHAKLDGPSDPTPRWNEGSLLRLTGLCRVDRAQQPATGITVTALGFELWLRGANDVVVLIDAPYWTKERLFMAVGVVAAAAFAAIGWGFTLRKRVREQTSIIRDKVKNESAMEERQRIAREFHDSLEQELAGLAMRLDALAVKVSDHSIVPLVSAVQRLAHSLQDEARHFIWNLRESRWENTGLAEALAAVVAERHASSGIAFEFSSTGTPQRLPALVSHHLFRIGQEAVANAAKHSGARRVEIVLAFEPERVRLVVRDDGRGFEPENAAGGRAGHFGLTGMQERALKIGAEFRLASEPGAGATVDLVLPLATVASSHPAIV